MVYRVLVVDDSNFMRHRLTEILNGDDHLEVVGSAGNGLDAIRMAAELQPDVITMDVEMPVMDGITAVRRIMRERPTPILMFSVSTQAGARATLEALDAGAMDFIPKQLHEISADKETAKRMLCGRVLELARHRAKVRASPPPRPTVPPAPRPRHPPSQSGHVRGVSLIAIAASTGGPTAVQKVLAALPAQLPVPVLVVQHMPGNFTGSFAERLNQVCAIEVREAKHGDELRPGLALVAPGGVQMELREQAGRRTIALREAAEGEYFRPSADVTFASLAGLAHSPRALVIVLTGMGSDGRQGAARLKARGAAVWAQDERSCVVYGMPKAIVDGRLADAVYDLDDMADELARGQPWTA
ncbi:protein-glutamate methylesterase/protein-glutamine glutaminase [Methylomagnum ishizawai]|uniref:protein-glutamate methylesterase/protein-glutamine glutaminase n=1 Tax=Methylomagnum ishizawai TaxID=1760988 RepID=UPI001C33A894|nr:chemotaxis response regulator protein-glutamate methylesterase [Methylomagnum ishizawai]BBL74725.1 chemotaxis response regulator protein-glutamate methylesterase of group 1 operon [Methylomagnum ishizawai]